MKGIILAGGLGSRLYPLTFCTSKQLLPVYDKPMIYYPLAVLMQAHIRDILIISMPCDLVRFKALFGDGSHLGLNLSFAVQEKPHGIAEAFIIGASFIGTSNVALILGDNIFYGHHLRELLKRCSTLEEGAIIFGYQVRNPKRYGVIAFDGKGHLIDIIEKPTNPPSSYAVTGLYFYDQSVIEIAHSLKPSSRHELEITDINKAYLKKKNLRLCLFDPGFAWLDMGTFEALHQASNYVQTIQERQGIQISCIEEIAFENGWISQKELFHLAEKQEKSSYGTYLKKLCVGIKTF